MDEEFTDINIVACVTKTGKGHHPYLSCSLERDISEVVKVLETTEVRFSDAFKVVGGVNLIEAEFKRGTCSHHIIPTEDGGIHHAYLECND